MRPHWQPYHITPIGPTQHITPRGRYGNVAAMRVFMYVA